MSKKILFLDRDGIINYDKGYTHKIEDFKFTEEIISLCLTAQNRGFLIVVVTNQAGIGHGYYTVAMFDLLTKWMIDQFLLNGVVIKKVYYCPYHPDANIALYRKNSIYRKPNSGMIVQALNDYQGDPSLSIIIGDKPSDMLAGKSANIGSRILVSNIEYSDEATINFASLAECHQNIDKWLK